MAKIIFAMYTPETDRVEVGLERISASLLTVKNAMLPSI